jgi:polar amino acid transport system permease protein
VAGNRGDDFQHPRWCYYRGLPVLVTLFLVFFVLPSFHVNVSLTVSALIGLSLWGSANIAEILRGGIQSVPRAQTLAAAALGFPRWQVLCWVILPQAIRQALPSTVGILVSLIQATALASAFGAVELLESISRSTQRLLLTTGNSHAFSLYGVVLVVYFSMCYPLTSLSRGLERRLRRT